VSPTLTSTLASPAAPASPERKLFPIRQRTGTASFHLSSQAVDVCTEDLEKLTRKEAVLLLAQARWGSTTTMICPHCGTLDTHYWRGAELRWKCRCCDKTFSVTSNTVFADHKLALTKIIKIAFAWANGASGEPALQLRRDWKVAYGTVFTLAHKLREGLLRGFNTGVLCSVQEMDGMDVNGRRYKEKRSKPLGGGKTPGGPKIPEHLLKPAAGKDFVGPPTPPKFGKAAKQPLDRRLILVMRQRGVSNGKGAAATRVAIAITESSKTVIAMATRFASAESVILSDEDPSCASFGHLFAAHKTINHSKGYSDGKGVSNNLAESFNWRMRRAVEGIYLSASNKYMQDYASEQAWREDTRRMSTGKKLSHLLWVALSVGLSRWWRGYTHGHHREEELLIEGDLPAPGRGRPKGWMPKPPR
jgi:transposase-like protein